MLPHLRLLSDLSCHRALPAHNLTNELRTQTATTTSIVTFLTVEEEEKGERGSSCLWWIQRACQMHWPRVAFVYVFVFFPHCLWLTFSAVLLCDLFDNHLRSLPCPPPLSLSFFNFLNNGHYVEKHEKLLFCALQSFSFCFSFGMQSEPHAKWVPISFVYSECN